MIRATPLRAPTTLRVCALAAVVAGGAALSGCASAGGGLTGDPADYGSPSARMAIERFLAAADAKDYQTMGQQFGTRSGPAEEKFGIAEVEQRMIVLSSLLRHGDASVRPEDLARTGPNRTRFMATLTGTRQGRVAVPVVAVRSRDGRWFVEQVDVSPLTRKQ